jgi:hypothetical protein
MDPSPALSFDYSDIDGAEAFAVDPPEWLYHYTTLSNAAQILKTKSLWLTKIQYLNDETELKLALTCFQRAIEAAVAAERDEEKRELFLHAADQIYAFEQTNICIGSFCDSGDLLSQWRSYASSGAGLALGFAGRRLKELQSRGYLNVWRCVYDPGTQDRLARGLVRLLEQGYETIRRQRRSDGWERAKAELIGRFSTTFLRVAPVFKNEHFAEEREWRLVTVPMAVSDQGYRAMITDERVSQFYVLAFEPPEGGKHDFISRVTVGPTANPERVCSTLQLYAMKEGFEQISCSRSAIPFRG